jgi:hypothetical protein
MLNLAANWRAPNVQYQAGERCRNFIETRANRQVSLNGGTIPVMAGSLDSHADLDGMRLKGVSFLTIHLFG